VASILPGLPTPVILAVSPHISETLTDVESTLVNLIPRSDSLAAIKVVTKFWNPAGSVSLSGKLLQSSVPFKSTVEVVLASSGTHGAYLMSE